MYNTGLEYVVEVKDIMSHDTLVVFTDNKSGQRETFACEIKALYICKKYIRQTGGEMRDKKRGIENDIYEILKSIFPCQVCKYEGRENYQFPCRSCIEQESYSKFTFKKGNIVNLAKNIEKYIDDKYECYDHDWEE